MRYGQATSRSHKQPTGSHAAAPPGLHVMLALRWIECTRIRVAKEDRGRRGLEDHTRIIEIAVTRLGRIDACCNHKRPSGNLSMAKYAHL